MTIKHFISDSDSLLDKNWEIHIYSKNATFHSHGNLFSPLLERLASRV